MRVTGLEPVHVTRYDQIPMNTLASNSDSFVPVACRLAGRCSGCGWIERPYEDQIADKLARLREAFAAAGLGECGELMRVVAIAPAGLRDRLDFTLERGPDGASRFGLYGGDQDGVLDIEECPALSPALASWLADARSALPSIARGSIRLRVGPDGARGAWLDLANVDVKRLLDERTELDRLRALGAVVEIGQRRKTLVERDGRLKLADPELRPWFETYLGANETPAPLYGPIGGFTQPGFKANRALVREVRSAFAATGARSAIEFGSGSGNFTLPIASLGARVVACEADELACAGLARSRDESGFSDQIEIRRGDFQAGGRARADFGGADAIVADPPRSGLKRFLDPLSEADPADRPKHFLYISCFAESLAEDARRLLDLGYQLRSVVVVDQFPQSPHFEAVATFGRD